MPENIEVLITSKAVAVLHDFLFDEDGLPRNNIAGDFSDEKLIEIGTLVRDEYEIDKLSREDWERQHKEIFELASQISETKRVGEDIVSNVKYPILATAALQYSARAYPNIVKGSDVVKCQVVGSDVGGVKAGKAKRVQQHMSYQILEQMDDWEDEMDQLLVNHCLVGCTFKKTYYNPVDKKNVSEIVFAKDLVVNYYAQSLEKARRVTHVIELYPNDIVERIRTGSFLDFDFEKEMAGRKDDEGNDRSDADLPHVFLEQHRWLDLDEDGYQEPYVVTIHKEGEKVVRIIPRYAPDGIQTNDDGEISRILPTQYFTQFPFMPAFDGNFYKMGFGSLLFAPVNIVNTIFNQLLDAGTLANRQGGFLGPGIKLKKGGGYGSLKFQQGEWKQISYMGDDIRRAVFALPVKEPSNVLFSLLGLMLDAVKELASQAEVLSGEQSKANVPATTTLALIEQGLKVFSAIYKRVYRSLKSEFKKLRRLNELFLSDIEYNSIIDYTQTVADPQTGEPVQIQVQAIVIEDYGDQFMDIIPVSGSADVSDTQRTIKAQALLELRGQGLQDDNINKRYLEALQIPDVNEILPPEGSQPPPDPKFIIEQEKLKLKKIELEIEARRQMAEESEKQGKIMQYWANSIKSLAEAEAVEAGPQMELYKSELKAYSEQQKAYTNLIGQLQNKKEPK